MDYNSIIVPPNTALEPTAAPLLCATVAAIRMRAVRSTVPARRLWLSLGSLGA